MEACLALSLAGLGTAAYGPSGIPPCQTHARAPPLTEAFDGEKAGVTLNHLESVLKPYAKPFKRQSVSACYVAGPHKAVASVRCSGGGCSGGAAPLRPRHTSPPPAPPMPTTPRRSHTPCGATISTRRHRNWTTGCKSSGRARAGTQPPLHFAVAGSGCCRSPPTPPAPLAPDAGCLLLQQFYDMLAREASAGRRAGQPRRPGLWPFRPRPTCQTAARGASTASCTRSPQP